MAAERQLLGYAGGYQIPGVPSVNSFGACCRRSPPEIIQQCIRCTWLPAAYISGRRRHIHENAAEPPSAHIKSRL